MALSGAITVTVVLGADGPKGRQYWANRLELSAPVGGVGIDPPLVAQAFAAAWTNVLLPAFWVDHILLSTYAPDSQPYNPSNLFVLPVGARGTRVVPAGSAALPLNNVLHVRKLTGSGRLGHLFLRGFLCTTDLTSDPNTGVVSLTDPDNFFTEMQALYDNIVAGLGGAATLAMISGTGVILQERTVTGFAPVGIKSRDYRTRRKSRLVENALDQARSILGDGGITVDEIPAVVETVTTLVRALGAELPPVPPLLP